MADRRGTQQANFICSFGQKGVSKFEDGVAFFEFHQLKLPGLIEDISLQSKL
jgi:hypothetical protein